MAKRQHDHNEGAIRPQPPVAADADQSAPASKGRRGSREPAQPSTDEQSGSTGRRTDGNTDTGKYTGQDKYGQSGGAPGPETDGQSRYRKSGPDGKDLADPDADRINNRVESDED